MAQQSTHHAGLARAEIELGEQVINNVVVVAGVEGDIGGASGLHHRAHNVQRLIAIEWRDFNGNDIVNLREFAPEAVWQGPSAYARLQVETDNRNHLCDGSRMLD